MSKLPNKLIDRNFFNPIFNTKVVLRASPLFCSFHCFARDYLQTGYSDMLVLHGRYPEKNEIVEESYHTPILC
jgi:hypothetical protein